MSTLYRRSSAEELAEVAALEEANRDATHARHMKMLAAARVPGLSGELRRAVSAAKRLPAELANACSIDVVRLEDFRAGEADLTVEEAGRLMTALGLRVVPAVAG
jgi:hypothetical protein